MNKKIFFLWHILLSWFCHILGHLRLTDYFCTTEINWHRLYKLLSTTVPCFSEIYCWIGDWGAEEHRAIWYIVSNDEGWYSNRHKNKEYWNKLQQTPARYMFVNQLTLIPTSLWIFFYYSPLPLNLSMALTFWCFFSIENHLDGYW